MKASIFSIILFLLREVFLSVSNINSYFFILIIIFLSIILISFRNSFISTRCAKTFYIFFNSLSTCLVINALARTANDRSIIYFDLVFKLYSKSVAKHIDYDESFIATLQFQAS